jgi:hypothetical protein
MTPKAHDRDWLVNLFRHASECPGRKANNGHVPSRAETPNRISACRHRQKNVSGLDWKAKIEDIRALHAPAEGARSRLACQPVSARRRCAMTDTLSLLLAHFLMAFIAIRILNSPDIDVEPDFDRRHFKTVGPRA